MVVCNFYERADLGSDQTGNDADPIKPYNIINSGCSGAYILIALCPAAILEEDLVVIRQQRTDSPFETRWRMVMQ